MRSRSTDELVAYCQDRMAVGSLSFSLASRLLGRREQDDVMLLYTWCRHCDDAIDSLPAATPVAVKQAAIERLRRDTVAALRGEPGDEPAFQALHALSRRRLIPADYFEELLRGMEMDAVGTVYASFVDLELYCFRVAGVVGLMFCHIVGVSSPKALQHAADLGIAMQLTNIARDLRADRGMGRDYLPRQWVAAEGEAGAFARLLKTAERYYASGEAGLRFLPLAAACAAAAARHVYGAIGSAIRRHDGIPTYRVVVPGWRKALLALKGVCTIAAQAPRRLTRPWSAITLTTVWRLP